MSPPKTPVSLRFRLRSLFVITTILCVVLGSKVKQVRDQRAAVKSLAAERAMILYGYHVNPKQSGPPGPKWLRTYLGDDFFAHVRWVSFVTPWLGGPTSDNIDDDLLRSVGLLKRLQRLDLEDCDKITDAGLRRLSHLAQLQELRLSGAEITDEGLIALQSLRDLNHLALDDTAVTDAGIAHLTPLQQLQELYLMDTAVTDACIADLAKLKELRTLDLDFTHVTTEGVNRLRRSLPSCKIYASKSQSAK